MVTLTSVPIKIETEMVDDDPLDLEPHIEFGEPAPPVKRKRKKVSQDVKLEGAPMFQGFQSFQNFDMEEFVARIIAKCGS